MTVAPVEDDRVSVQREAGRVLVQRVQDGDRAAFGEIYSIYRLMVYKFVYHRVGIRQLAEDISQETFARALKRIPTFKWQGTDVGAWLVTIARNLIADHYKSGWSRLVDVAETPTENRLDVVRKQIDDHNSPEVLVGAYLESRAIWSAAQRITDQQRQVVVLRFLEGLSVEQTAARMGVNAGAVKALQYRAVRALRREMQLAGDV